MRAFLTITLALNVILSLVFWRSPRAQPSATKQARFGNEPAPSASSDLKTNARVVVVTAGDGSPWTSLAAGDYRETIIRLRDAGCPEETIRDIIIAAVSRNFHALLVRQDEERYRNYQWWRGIQDSEADFHPSKWQALRTQRDLELSQLLGPDWRADLNKTVGWPAPASGQDAWISAEKRQEMELLNAKYWDLEDDVRKTVRGSFLLEEEEARLKELKKQKRAELAELLTPKELEDLDVRQSPAANWVRQRLPEAASEDEFRKMVRAALLVGKDTSTETALLDGESPEEAMKCRAANEAKFQAQLKAELGEARYAELFSRAEPGKDPEPTFDESAERSRKELVKLAEKAGVSADAANQAHTRLVALIKAFEIKNGDLSKLTQEQQEVFQKSMKAEGEKIFTETMGEKGRAVFKRMNHEN